MPISKVALQGEAYYVANRTREAVEGYQLTNTERLGAMTGVGWYVQLSAWPLGDAFVQGDPGFARPTHVDLDKEAEKPKRGLELLAIVSAVNAHYAGASRGGVADGKTPAGDIDIFSYGAGLSYWHTKHLRLSINYIAYHTPGSASEENLAGVPGNQAKVGESKEAHLLHELGVTGDVPLLAVALLAPLELPILEQQVEIEGFPIDRLYHGWVDLARRIVAPAAPA